MKKFLIPLLFLAMLALPAAVYAHSLDIDPAQFFACEAPATDANAHVTAGDIDANSITQEATLDCSKRQDAFTSTVKWSVTGPQGVPGTPGKDGTNGTNGTDGTNGTNGTNGKDGVPGIPFTHAACTEALTGSAQQENMVFCISGIEPDGGSIYQTAIGAASHQIIVGTPVAVTASVDWSGDSITYVEFTSGFHMEYHSDNKVRVYNTLNRQVF